MKNTQRSAKRKMTAWLVASALIAGLQPACESGSFEEAAFAAVDECGRELPEPTLAVSVSEHRDAVEVTLKVPEPGRNLLMWGWGVPEKEEKLPVWVDGGVAAIPRPAVGTSTETFFFAPWLRGSGGEIAVLRFLPDGKVLVEQEYTFEPLTEVIPVLQLGWWKLFKRVGKLALKLGLGVVGGCLTSVVAIGSYCGIEVDGDLTPGQLHCWCTTLRRPSVPNAIWNAADMADALGCP